MVHDTGTTRILRTYNQPSLQLQWNSQNNCQQGMGISSVGTPIHTTPHQTNSAINIYVQNSTTGERYYLKVDIITRQVSLECQSALDNVSSYTSLCKYNDTCN